MSRPRTPLAERLLRRRVIDPATGCWNWTGHIQKSGYGQIRLPDGPKTESTHRASYKTFVGPIPDGLHLDHLCKNTKCFNPEHLEPVTPLENNRRSESPCELNRLKTECIQGHEFSPENTYISVRPNGLIHRRCKTCQADAMRRYYARRRNAA